MEQSTLSIRVNSKDKSNFEKFCTDTGMNVSVAVNMFIKTVLREQKLPFEIKSSIYDEQVYEKIKEADEEMDNTTQRYTSDEVYSSLEDIARNV